MSTIAAFTDLMAVTRGVASSAIEKIQSDATSYRRYLTRLMQAGMAKSKMLQGGPNIIDFIQLNFTNSYQEYSPTQDFNWTDTNSLTQITLPWKYAMVSATWYDHEVILSSGSLETTFKRVKDAKMAELELSFWEGREKSLWATPDVITMEGTTVTGSQWHSLRAYITEDGLAPSSTNGGVNGSNWTTILGVNPSTFTNWRNQVESYNPAAIDTQLPRALDLMWDDVQFESPSDSQQYVQDTSMQKTAILTNRDGYAILMDLTRNKNDNTYSKENDLGMLNGVLTYHGLPIKRIGAFEDAGVMGTVYPVGSPRFWFPNFNFIYPIYHEQRFLAPITVNTPTTKPQAHITAKDTYGELWIRSRRTSGIVVPSATA
jgi:hypothetical protein